MRFFNLLFGLVSAASILAAPIAIAPKPELRFSPSAAPISKWLSSPSHLFQRAPTYRFNNCSPEQEAAIRSALANIQTLVGRILDVSDTVQSEQLVYLSIFGDPRVAEALNQDFQSQVALVRGNLQRIATLDQQDVTITFNCDPNGTNKRNQGSKECANTWPPDRTGNIQMNLFGNPNTPTDGGFLNQPSWAQTMVELNRNADGTPGPVTVVCSSLDFLMRTQESILIHELMHVQGIGMQQNGNRIIDQQLPDGGAYAYGENGIRLLAQQNPQLAVENADNYAAYVTAVAVLHENYYTAAAQTEYNNQIGITIWEAEQRPTPQPVTPPPGYSPPPFDVNDTGLEYEGGGDPPPGFGGSVPYLYGGVLPDGLPGWQPPGASGGGSGGSYFA